MKDVDLGGSTRDSGQPHTLYWSPNRCRLPDGRLSVLHWLFPYEIPWAVSEVHAAVDGELAVPPHGVPGLAVHQCLRALADLLDSGEVPGHCLSLQ